MQRRIAAKQRGTTGKDTPGENPLYAGSGNQTRRSGAPGVRLPDEAGRTAYRKDYARLLHAPSFRRLQGKTQLFPGGESDFFRNRLTHSLEVAQIAQGIAATLNATQVPEHFQGGRIDEDIVQFAALAHDLGHPPFGHNGEAALDELMRRYGGFEGNAQTLRILAAVEQKLVAGRDGQTASLGLDLTHRSLASVLKYDNRIPSVRKKSSALVKGYYSTEASVVEEIRASVAPGLPRGAAFKTIECSIMDVADDIAYSTYDLEDSLHAGFVTPLSLADALANEDIRREVTRKSDRALVAERYAPVEGPRELFEAIARIFKIGTRPSDSTLPKRQGSKSPTAALATGLEFRRLDKGYASDSTFRTSFTAERVGRLICAVELVPNRDYPQLSRVRLRRQELLEVEVLKHLNFEVVIRSPQLSVVEHRGREIVMRTFEAIIASRGALLQAEWRRIYEQQLEIGYSNALRVACDYVACMTDRYAVEFHERLFGNGASMFKPL